MFISIIFPRSHAGRTTAVCVLYVSRHMGRLSESRSSTTAGGAWPFEETGRDLLPSSSFPARQSDISSSSLPFHFFENFLSARARTQEPTCSSLSLSLFLILACFPCWNNQSDPVVILSAHAPPPPPGGPAVTPPSQPKTSSLTTAAPETTDNPRALAPGSTSWGRRCRSLSEIVRSGEALAAAAAVGGGQGLAAAA